MRPWSDEHVTVHQLKKIDIPPKSSQNNPVMKPIYSYALLAAFAAVGSASAVEAVTTPVGYETVTLAPGTFNLTGARLLNAPVAAGTFESNTSATLVDNQASFSFTASKSYSVEFPSGATITALGSDFSSTTLSNLTGITASYLGAYVIRESLTIGSVFGAANEAGLASTATAEATDADLIYIPDGAGGFTRVFYSTFIDTEAATPEEQQLFFGWLNADDFSKVSSLVIDPAAGFFVQTVKSLAPINLVIRGEVKKTPTAFVANDSFTLMGGIYPAGSTLNTSGLKDYVLGSPTATATEADVVLLTDGTGGFIRAFYSTFVDTEAATPEEQQLFFGWLSADDFSKIPNQPISPGFFINKLGPNISGLMSPPVFYSSL